MNLSEFKINPQVYGSFNIPHFKKDDVLYHFDSKSKMLYEVTSVDVRIECECSLHDDTMISIYIFSTRNERKDKNFVSKICGGCRSLLPLYSSIENFKKNINVLEECVQGKIPVFDESYFSLLFSEKGLVRDNNGQQEFSLGSFYAYNNNNGNCYLLDEIGARFVSIKIGLPTEDENRRYFLATAYSRCENRLSLEHMRCSEITLTDKNGDTQSLSYFD